jgi:rare lipoprotein A
MGRILLLLAILVLPYGFLTACSQVQLASHMVKQMPLGGTDYVAGKSGPYKVGRPYTIKGVRYTPREDYSYDETGIASWYGPNFHGRPTANGERFDQWKVSAAHKTLQIPSVVRVTNLENGRSLKVRVNDRGPFARGRIIDMSRRGAQLLGFEKQGTARVRVQVLRDESLRTAAAAKAGGRIPKIVDSGVKLASAGDLEITKNAEPKVSFNPVDPTDIYIQVGAFSVADNARAVQARLQPVANVQLQPARVNGQLFHRVRIGPIDNVQSADGLLDQVINYGFSAAEIIVRERL